MNRRGTLLFGLLVVAAWLAIFGDKTPHGEQRPLIVEPTRRNADPAARPSQRAVGAPVTSRQNASAGEIAALHPRAQPAPRGDSAARELFTATSWTPPPAKSVVVAVPKPPPPTAPPLPFKYLGKKFEADRWEVYLERGEQLLIAREGEKLAGVYEIEDITPTTMTLIYLPLKQTQTISIGGPP